MEKELTYTLYFTVTNDLSYDQRMIRICSSLATAGYHVHLVGRKLLASIPLKAQPFQQVRLNCWFKNGKLFYAEYNLRLFFFLFAKKMDGICAIDLDTILPCLFISKLKKIPRIYDAHELFCEMKEIVARPAIYRVWKSIERYAVPKFEFGYTVNTIIANEFEKMYHVNYGVVRSISSVEPSADIKKEKFILYQGAVNEGRCFEQLIPAMKSVDACLIICGEGNFLAQAKASVVEHQLQDKIIFEGLIDPEKLLQITQRAYIGITLFEKESRSNYLSLANRFFDYMHAAVPQLCVDFPLYREINDQYEIASLVDEITTEQIAEKLNRLLTDEAYWKLLHLNCLEASKVYNWENEEKKLIGFYKKIFG